MTRVGGGRNFGFGKTMSWAGKNALQTAYLGHFATVAAHTARWEQFSAWAKEHGVKDSRDVTKELVVAYGRELAGQVRQGATEVAYAQNLLSSVNVTLAALRGDRAIKVSPSALVGQRSSVRTAAPYAMDRERVTAAARDLADAGHARAASVLELAREFGLREKEASLLNLRDALHQVQTRHAINVVEGTKGGRGKEVDRWVPASNRSVAILERAITAADGGRNLIPADKSFRQFNNHVHAVTAPVFERSGLRGIHDLRAAYACERYHQLTRHEAPAVAGYREASRGADREARKVIAEELGHGRAEVATAYVGSAR